MAQCLSFFEHGYFLPIINNEQYKAREIERIKFNQNAKIPVYLLKRISGFFKTALYFTFTA